MIELIVLVPCRRRQLCKNDWILDFAKRWAYTWLLCHKTFLGDLYTGKLCVDHKHVDYTPQSKHTFLLCFMLLQLQCQFLWIYMWHLPILFRITFIVTAVSGVAVPSIAIWEMLYQKHVSRTGTSNYIPQIMCDVITCPCHWYVNTVAVWNNRDSFAPSCRYGTLFVSNLQRALRI